MSMFAFAQPAPALYNTTRSDSYCQCKGRRLLRASKRVYHSPKLRSPYPVAMAAVPSDVGDKNSSSDGKPKQTHMDTELAKSALKDAIAEANCDIHEVAAKCALGFADAFVQCYSADDAPAVFVVCGAGFNGLVGLYVAAQLRERGYEPAVYAANGSRHINISKFCEENSISFYDFLPSTLEFYFQVVVDALLGLGFDGGDIQTEYWSVFEMLISTRLAIASVDVPSGWDLEKGPRKIDVTANTFIKPELLVSLGAPKNCSKMFAGGYHFIAGRHLPQEYFAEKGVSVPSFPGSESNCVLFSSNPFRFQGGNGEVYGRPGQFNATLYTKNPKRTWVDVEEDMELWDELD